MTFNRVCTGVFDIHVDGVKLADWQVVNGSVGLSGRDTNNVYGLANHATGYVKWLGPLRTAKALAELKFGGGKAAPVLGGAK